MDEVKASKCKAQWIAKQKQQNTKTISRSLIPPAAQEAILRYNQTRKSKTKQIDRTASGDHDYR